MILHLLSISLPIPNGCFMPLFVPPSSQLQSLLSEDLLLLELALVLNEIFLNFRDYSFHRLESQVGPRNQVATGRG